MLGARAGVALAIGRLEERANGAAPRIDDRLPIATHSNIQQLDQTFPYFSCLLATV